VRTGEFVEAGLLESPSVGRLEVEPGSRLKAGLNNRFALERGVIHALIWAPPQEFVVDTPSAKAIDLGCKYTLRVDADGSGLVEVELGWVAFQSGRRESFIPAGAQCRTSKRRGPGTPFYATSSAEFRAALADFDAGRPTLARILAAAEPRDALTLWHLLSRTQAADRAEVTRALGRFVRLPDAEAVARGDQRAIDAARKRRDCRRRDQGPRCPLVAHRFVGCRHSSVIG